MSAISVTECNRYRHLLVRYGDTNTIIWNTYTKTRITAHQTKLGVKCERGLQSCAKFFRTFKGGRMTLWIIQSVIIVWIMVYIVGFVRWRTMPFIQDTSQTTRRLHKKNPWIHISLAIQAYKWRTTKYTHIVALSNHECHTLVSDEDEKKFHSKPFSRGKTGQMLPRVRLQRNIVMSIRQGLLIIWSCASRISSYCLNVSLHLPLSLQWWKTCVIHCAIQCTRQFSARSKRQVSYMKPTQDHSLSICTNLVRFESWHFTSPLWCAV